MLSKATLGLNIGAVQRCHLPFVEFDRPCKAFDVGIRLRDDYVPESGRSLRLALVIFVARDFRHRLSATAW